MTDLERFINDDSAFDADPLITSAARSCAANPTTTGCCRPCVKKPMRLRVGRSGCSTFKFYCQDLINNLFMHLYTKIEFVERDLKVSRLTATKYPDALAGARFVQNLKVGTSNYYVNLALNEILIRNSAEGAPADA